MIDVSEVLNDPDVCSVFTIQRNPGTYAIGGWQAGQPVTIQAYGAVRNTSGKEVEMVNEGDRVREMMTFRSTTPMYVTSSVQGATSDVLTWQGDQYRVLAVKNYSEQGYYLAVAGRMLGS